MAPWPLEGRSRQRSCTNQGDLEDFMVASNWRHAHRIIFNVMRFIFAIVQSLCKIDHVYVFHFCFNV